MKKIYIIICIFLSIKSYSQSHTYISGDTVVFRAVNGSNLQILSPTKDTVGVLWNYGNGITGFKSIAQIIGTTWGTSGNSGLTSSNFLGTTDNIPLNFKVNNLNFGFLEAPNTGGLNTALGQLSLSGYDPGISLGNLNSAFGANSLQNTTDGELNSAFGQGSLQNNTIGNDNSAFGRAALLGNILGNFNNAFGVGALITNTSGSNNNALGFGALQSNTTGSFNIGLGFQAGTGINNSNTFYISDNTNHMYYKLDSASGTTPPSVIGKDASGYWHVYASPAGGGGTVTSVAALTLGTTGTDLSSSVANSTTTPVITINVPTASASNRGALSSADWSIFNNKASSASVATKVDSVRYILGSDTAKQYSGGVGSKSFLYQRVFNVKDYGAKGDSLTDDTQAIQAAIQACSDAGGGTVYFPNPPVYYKISGALQSCNCQIPIPPISGSSPLRNHITLLGETKPAENPAGLGLISDANTPIAKGMVRLVSTLTTGAAGAAVIGSAQISGNFNKTELSVENLSIQIKNNPAGAGPVIGGINYKNGGTLNTNWVNVYIDTPAYRSTAPLNNISGIELPDDGSGQSYNISNTQVIGFRSGYIIGENTILNGANAIGCYYGFKIKFGHHNIVSTRAAAFWCVYDIYVEGACTLQNFNLDAEYQHAGNWYDDINTVKDSANLATGTLFYTIIRAAAGKDNAQFSKSGGVNLNCVGDSYIYQPDATHVVVGNQSASLNNGTFQNLYLSGTSGGVIELQSGATRYLQIYGSSSSNGLNGISNLPLIFNTNSTERMRLDGTAMTMTDDIVFTNDNTNDIGKTTGNRPRNVIVGNAIRVGTGANFASPSDGVLTIWNNASSDLSKIQLGGVTASFPALNRSGTTVQLRLADGSGNADITANTAAFGSAATTSSQFQVNSSGNIVKLNNVTTSFPSSNSIGVLKNDGLGNFTWSSSASNIVASADLTSQSAAGNIVTYTTGAADSSFMITANINVTAVSVDVIQTQVVYTDETNTSRTLIFYGMGATSAGLTSTGVSNYAPMAEIRVKASTTITVQTTLTTGAGSITFNAHASIFKIR